MQCKYALCNNTDGVYHYFTWLRSYCVILCRLQIVQVLQQVCHKESLNLPPELAQRIAELSSRNLRRALLMCETCRVQQYPFSADQHVTEPDWEVFLRETARLIVQQQTPRR